MNSLLSAIVAFLATVVFYAVLLPFDGTRIAEMFTKQGLIPYFIVFFTSWSLAIKWRKLAFQ